MPRPKKKKPAAGTQRNLARPAETLTKQRILEIATQEFSRRGYDGARIDEIMRRSKVSKNLVYHYFKSKEKLFIAVLDAAYRRMQTRLDTLSLETEAPIPGMRKLIREVFRYWGEAPDFIGLLGSENFHKARHLRQMDAIPDGYPKLIKNIQRLLDLGRKDGDFHSRVDPVDLYISIAALGYHYFSNIHTLSALFNRDFSAPRETAARLQHIEDLILGYLLNGKKNAMTAARR